MRAGVLRAFSSRFARTRGVGRYMRYTSSTWPGISIHSAVDTSCSISAMGNNGARSAGPIGCFVPGCNGGDGGFGIDGTTLNQAVGIWLSRSVNLVARAGIAPPLLGSVSHSTEEPAPRDVPSHACFGGCSQSIWTHSAEALEVLLCDRRRIEAGVVPQRVARRAIDQRRPRPRNHNQTVRKVDGRPE